MSIILPVVNEVQSLATTVDLLLADNRPAICELLIVVCDRTTSESLAVVEELHRTMPDLVVVHEQSLPFLGGALREAFALARGSHVVMMATDLETNPADVSVMIDQARAHPDAIITASRWRQGGTFEGYGLAKLAANWIFQRFFSRLYGVRLTDMTYGFRIFPAPLVKAISWQQLHHAFLFETLVKPLRMNVQVIEIPSRWTARTEGRSSNSFRQFFPYIAVGIRTRFASRESLLKDRSRTAMSE